MELNKVDWKIEIMKSSQYEREIAKLMKDELKVEIPSLGRNFD